MDRRPLSRLDGRPLILLPLAVSGLVYLPILRNYFRDDDFLDFFHLQNRSLFDFLITVHAGHSVVSRNLVWWALERIAGPRAPVFFATALLTHLVTVGLLFEIVRRLTGSARAACASALLWGSAPVQEESLGWYAVYGHLLVTTILAWFLHRFSQLRERPSWSRVTPLGWAVLVGVMITSFGVGLGVAMALPVVAFLLLPPSRTRTRAVATLGAFAALTPLVYMGLLALHSHRFGPYPGLAPYAWRDHPVALLQLEVFLLGHGIVGLFSGVLPETTTLPMPAAWAILAAFCSLVLVAIARGPARDRRVVIAGLVLALACYAPIAAGRVLFFANGIPYDRMDRFQYAATLALALTAGGVLAQLGPSARVSRTATDVALAGLAATLVLFQVFLRRPFDHHDGARRETIGVLTAIRAAIDAAPPGGDVYVHNVAFRSVGQVLNSRMDIFPGWAGVFVIFFPDNVVDGKPVHFVSEKPVVEALRDGRRTAGLLVTGDERRAARPPHRRDARTAPTRAIAGRTRRASAPRRSARR